MSAEKKIEELGIVLPEPFQLPADLKIPFQWVRVHGDRAYIAGHVPLKQDGSIYEPVGKVGADVSVDEGYSAARQTGLAILSSLRRELGSLDRITAWLRVFGMVNGAPGFVNTAPVINGFSDLIIEVFGEEVGKHSRAAVGMAELPFHVPVEIEAEVAIR